MKTTFVAVLVATVLLVAPGCYTLNQMNAPTGTQIEITNIKNATTSEHVVLTKWVNHFIVGLVTPSDPDIGRMLADEVKARGGKAAVNVRINYQMTFVNGLLNFLTASIYNPFTLTVEADIVK